MAIEEIEMMREQLLSFVNQTQGKIQIVDHPIPMQLQVEYAMEYQRLSPFVQHLNQHDLDCFVDKARTRLNYSKDLEEKRDLLTVLSSIKLPKAHEVLKEFINYGDSSLRSWARMADMGCRMNLIEDFTGDNLIFVASGLGGEDDSIRYSLVLLDAKQSPFSDFEKSLIEKECRYQLECRSGKLNELDVQDRYVRMVFLMPITESPRYFLNALLNSINEFQTIVQCPDAISNNVYFTRENAYELLGEPQLQLVI